MIGPASTLRAWGFLLALLAVLLASACSGRKAEAIPRGAVVVVLGDSLTAGYGLDAGKSWTTHLAAASGWQVVNAGVSGDTVAQGQARLAALLEAHRPAAVLVELGGNDMLRRQPQRETVAGLEAIVDQVRAAGARPVLVATPAPSLAGAVFRNLADAAFYAEIGKRRDVPVIEDAVADVLSQPELKLDQLHPNADGHRVLAAQVVRKLKRVGLLE